jgi:signal recognition particle subunit SRP54
MGKTGALKGLFGGGAPELPAGMAPPGLSGPGAGLPPGMSGFPGGMPKLPGLGGGLPGLPRGFSDKKK